MINSLGYWRKGSCGWLQGDVIFDSHYVPPVLEWGTLGPGATKHNGVKGLLL